MKKVHKRSGKAGLPPGSLVKVGGVHHEGHHAHVFLFDPDSLSEEDVTDPSTLKPPEPGKGVLWFDMHGSDDVGMLNAVAAHFDLHPLMVEDVLNFDHRPKVEEYPNHLFVVSKMLSIDRDTGTIGSEQVSFVLGRSFVLSFQERPGDVLEPIRDRLRNNLGRVRRSSADYLLYVLLDVIVDHYFHVTEELGRRIEELERKVTSRPGNEDLLTIQGLRGELISVGRTVTPTRELAGRLTTMDSDLLERGTRRYINDLQDHTVYIAETIGTLRDQLASLENTYHAMVNLRMGQVMKLLTVISTIFMPLTFLAGVYGMNFHYMPELAWQYGYFVVLGAMALISLVMVLWLRRRRWL
jgi:magnesium transporter